MKKNKTVFVCNQCGHTEPKWLGKCSQCEQWNTFTEEKENAGRGQSVVASNDDVVPRKFCEIQSQTFDRIKIGIDEVDRVFGGGLVAGSLTLIGGEPGVGKSTLLLEIAHYISKKKSTGKVLYVSGEESEGQVASRARRMGLHNSEILFMSNTRWEDILATLKKIKPILFILDSIQTTVSHEIQSPPGTISQIREITYQIMNYAKAYNVTSMVIGHVTKDGSIAGPKALEHMVDTVVYFEGDQVNQYRVLRSIKNRFGNTSEIGMFEMSERGLEQIKNPSLYFIEGGAKNNYGRAISCTLEGSRSIFVEVQSLVVENKYGNGRRTTQGVDVNRLSMLLAVLEKYLGIPLQFNDVYLNIATGLKLSGREADLAIVASLLSSIYEHPFNNGEIFLGEVGLTGEVRPVPSIDQRVKEASAHSFGKIYISNRDIGKIKLAQGCKIIGVDKVSDFAKILNLPCRPKSIQSTTAKLSVGVEKQSIDV